MKICSFRGDSTDISAKKKALSATSVFVFAMKLDALDTVDALILKSCLYITQTTDFRGDLTDTIHTAVHKI